jgi:hypothetical protein
MLIAPDPFTCRQPGGLGEIPGFASPPRDGFALSDDLCKQRRASGGLALRSGSEMDQGTIGPRALPRGDLQTLLNLLMTWPLAARHIIVPRCRGLLRGTPTTTRFSTGAVVTVNGGEILGL